MSHAATVWAFEQASIFPDMNSDEQLVLIRLADRHDPDRGCFASEKSVAAEINLTVDLVNEQINKLQSRGLIKIDTGFDGEGCGFTKWVLAFEVGFDALKGGAA